MIKGGPNFEEWEKRAKRKGLVSVMSSRWSEKECLNATNELRKKIFSFIPSLRDKVILEIGCGIGRFTGELAKFSKKVYAIDISSSMLKRAKENTKERNVIFLSSDALDTDLPANSIDFIFEVRNVSMI